MIVRQKTADPSLVEKLRGLVRREFDKMKVTFMEGDLAVTTALVDDEIEKLVIYVLEEARQPLSWRDLKVVFSGIVGEDRLRRILNSLKANNEIAELTHTRYAKPEYVPLSEIGRVKNPGIINKVLESKRETQ